MLTQLQLLEQQGIIRALDYQFAKLIHAMNPDPLLTLAAANVSFELGQGNVCMTLASDFSIFGLDETESAQLMDTIAIPKEQWMTNLKNTQVVGEGNEPTPLVLDSECLYLYRYWEYECNIARFLKSRSTEALDADEARSMLQRLFKRDYPDIAQRCKGKSEAAQKAELIKWLDIESIDGLDWDAILDSVNQGADPDTLNSLIPESACLNWQKIAAALAATRSFSVISGGPGTGKTTTVTRLLALLTELGLKRHSPPDIKLVAPTGKAAARLTESIGGALAKINCSETVREMIPTQAGTLHRLLGVIPGKTGFIHNKNNRLHLDILVVDEASMIDLPLMSHLLEALPDHARLILLGDRDQLSSVEAGSVLGDICAAASFGYSNEQRNLLERLTGHDLAKREPTQAKTNHAVSDSLCLLRKSYRFDAHSGIGNLAKAVNNNDHHALKSVFTSGFDDIARFSIATNPDYQQLIQQSVESYRHYLELIQQKREPQHILDAFSRFQVLCALREGPYGLSGLNEAIENALQQKGLIEVSGQWYEGRPVLITRNDHGLGLYNGDIGITIRGSDGQLRIAFQLPYQQVRQFLPSRLPEHETVFAMTIHKSQGSEFANVVMVLPDKDSPIITRELVYTGITRAKSKLTLFAEMDILIKAAKSPTKRQSGLYQRLVQ
ncbi:exodeoxyribonuclease V subunit alpha [Endozoicomonas sp. SCSIO W0465]|uniref:exodeoxyribonuclease V subunit alpha n=1 Tax=Endozoicomonas sp. SCSIO W0465 TaxID=2918516 RepID=UPI00207561D8|nr:exodeoxyribonuclease V subunit alpha [Endozoicomonas sp. SCSIO W0465]USE39050.1 exodeoxyribonuclease V subunit alpha [Endozoicomonas sp. SCSIO W0465]